jgi:hypothetical protein
MAKNLLGLERILRDADKVNCKIALWGWLGPSRYTDSELMLTDCAKLIQALQSAGIPCKAEEFRAIARRLKHRSD